MNDDSNTIKDIIMKNSQEIVFFFGRRKLSGEKLEEQTMMINFHFNSKGHQPF